MNVQERLLQERIDPALTTDNLSTLASRALNQDVTALEYRILTGGCWNRVIAVHIQNGDELVFKIGPEPGQKALEREFHVLRYFCTQTAMPVPRPLLLDLSGETIPGSLLIMTKIPGEALHQMYYRLGPEDVVKINLEIAEYVTLLHSRRERGFGGVDVPEDKRHREWASFWLPRFDKVIEEVGSGTFIETKMLDEVKDVRNRFHEVLEIGAMGTLTHYDIWSGNVMIDNRSGVPHVSGFIDIPGYFADYAREISFMYLFGVADGTFFSKYGEVHDLDRDFELRLNIYNLKMHLKHITMYPQEQFYRRGAEQCLLFIKNKL